MAQQDAARFIQEVASDKGLAEKLNGIELSRED